jgi:hypothetical protein
METLTQQIGAVLVALSAIGAISGVYVVGWREMRRWFR